ncbi:immunoglobulin superfamily member 8 [Platysternon megacephalum]|nr:immunoglobulin superfamily member 8 [Platysternon megacephalum]
MERGKRNTPKGKGNSRMLVTVDVASNAKAFREHEPNKLTIAMRALNKLRLEWSRASEYYYSLWSVGYIPFFCLPYKGSGIWCNNAEHERNCSGLEANHHLSFLFYTLMECWPDYDRVWLLIGSTFQKHLHGQCMPESLTIL